jgi:hypothetical protein
MLKILGWLLVFFLFSFPLLYPQDAGLQLLTTALAKLKESEAHIQNLNKDIQDSKMIIAVLSKDKEQLETLNRLQQQELDLASMSLEAQSRARKEQSQEYEKALETLSASYNDIWQDNQAKDRKIITQSERMRGLLLWAILATLAAVLPWVIKLLLSSIRKRLPP